MSDETFVDERDAEHPIRWTSASDGETKYLSLEDAVRRIARSMIDPDAEAIQAGLMAGQRYGTGFAMYEYVDPA
jgi:hypothetical protein